MDTGAGLRCDTSEPGSTACKTLVHSKVDGPMRRSTDPSGRLAQPKGHCPSTHTNEPAPLGRGAHPKGHRPSTLTNEPAPLGRVAHPKGHRPSTLTNEPAPLGRGAYSKGHRPSTLTNPPWGWGAHPKGLRPDTLTNKPFPLGRGVHPKGQQPDKTNPIGQGGTSKGSSSSHSYKQTCPIMSSGSQRLGEFEWRTAVSS